MRAVIMFQHIVKVRRIEWVDIDTDYILIMSTMTIFRAHREREIFDIFAFFFFFLECFVRHSLTLPVNIRPLNCAKSSIFLFNSDKKA